MKSLGKCGRCKAGLLASSVAVVRGGPDVQHELLVRDVEELEERLAELKNHISDEALHTSWPIRRTFPGLVQSGEKLRTTRPGSESNVTPVIFTRSESHVTPQGSSANVCQCFPQPANVAPIWANPGAIR